MGSLLGWQQRDIAVKRQALTRSQQITSLQNDKGFNENMIRWFSNIISFSKFARSRGSVAHSGVPFLQHR